MLKEYTIDPNTGEMTRIGGSGGGGSVQSVDTVEANASGDVELTRFVTRPELEDLLDGTTESVSGVRYLVKADNNNSQDNWVEEAPEDGKLYGRKDAEWEEVIEEAPEDGKTYGRKNADWAEITNDQWPNPSFLTSLPLNTETFIGNWLMDGAMRPLYAIRISKTFGNIFQLANNANFNITFWGNLGVYMLRIYDYDLSISVGASGANETITSSKIGKTSVQYWSGEYSIVSIDTAVHLWNPCQIIIRNRTGSPIASDQAIVGIDGWIIYRK